MGGSWAGHSPFIKDEQEVDDGDFIVTGQIAGADLGAAGIVARYVIAGVGAAAGKATFIGALGVDGAKREAAALVERAVTRLEAFGEIAQPLRDFGDYVLNRRG